MSDNKKSTSAPSSAAQLAQSLLSASQPPANEAETTEDKDASESVLEAGPSASSGPEDAPDGARPQELIEIYFELEDPTEKDVALEEIARHRSPEVDAFLGAMMREDDDAFMRVQAAVFLAQRGNEEGLVALKQQLDDPDDIDLFATAMEGLIDSLGPTTYDLLHAVLSNSARNEEERQYALTGMEQLDPGRASTDIAGIFQAAQHMAEIPAGLIESAVAVFVAASEEPRGVEALEQLRQCVDADPALAEDDKDELRDYIGEAISLLTVS